MRREGRPRGMVRTIAVLPAPINPRPATRILNKLDSAPAAGVFAKVAAKPTNHSKFTGKCEKARCSDCHIHPVGKSKDKSKGTQKTRSSNDKLNYRVLTWRVMSDHDFGSQKLPVGAGCSASRILDELDLSHHEEYAFDHDDYDGSNFEDYDKNDNGCDDNYDGKYDFDDSNFGQVVDVNGVIVDDHDEIVVDAGEEMYDVGMVWDPVEDDEGWSLVVAGR